MPGEETAPRMLEPSSALAAIERARFDSYSSLVRNLHWLAAALVVLYSLLFPTSERLTLWSLAGVMMVYTLLLHSQLFARLPVEARVWLETALDLAWITAVIVWTGATRSPFAFLYYIVLYSSMPTASRRETYAKAGAATALLATVAVLAAGRSLPTVPAAGAAGWWTAGRSLVWPATGLWLVAYFSAEAGSLGADLHRSLFVAAHTDALTGLPNLRYFTAAAGLRSKMGPYTIVMVDIDHLKTVNDTFGHAQGSTLIRAVADAIRSAARSNDDLCSRVGGDEFIVRLAGATGDGALAYCRRVRAHLGDHPLEMSGVVLPISVSMGLASYPEHGRTLSEVTERADAALYAGKRDGRSRDRVWAA